MKGMLSIILAKRKVIDNARIQNCLLKLKREWKTFLIFVMGFSLPREISDVFLCFWKSLFLFTLNTSYCKELQEVFKNRLAVMPMVLLGLLEP